METLTNLSKQLASGTDLESAQIEAATEALTQAEVSADEKMAFLSALAEKGETAIEVADFASAFRERALNPGLQAWSDRAIDVVGTGGDHSGGFNISSMVVLTLAAAGVPAMKHGNRGMTSQCGSADLLTGLGVDLAAPPEKLQQAMEQLGFVFFFAPNYHPAFKHIVSVRKALAAEGKRTVFNILGPLINPGRPAHVLLGSFSEVWVPRLADALGALGVKSGLASHGVIEPGKGIDELTTATTNTVRGVGRLAHIDEVWSADKHGLVKSPFSDLVGGDLAANLKIVDAILDGNGPQGLVDTIVLNAAVAMWIVGRTSSVEEGLPRARELLVGGAVRQKISDTREFYN